MWFRRSHMLAPLTRIFSSKIKFKWTRIEQNTFEGIDRIVAQNTLLLFWILMKNLKIIPMITK